MRYLDIIRQVEAARKQQENLSVEQPHEQKAPVRQITWLGNDGKLRGPAEVDAIHHEEDGTVWAFLTLPDGWAAVNTKYVTPVRTF